MPDNLKLDFTLDQRTKNVMLNASVVLMSAINKGDLNEKKEYYHVFNDFSSKTRELFSAGVREMISIDVSTIPSEKPNIELVPLLLERGLVRILAENYDLIKKDCANKPEFSQVMKYIREFRSR